MDRRWRWLYISDEAFLLILRAIQNRAIITTLELDDGTPVRLPEGWNSHDVQYDFLRRAFIVRITHPTFDEVPEGHETPFGGILRVRSVPVKEVSVRLGAMIDERDAIIHDLREQLAGRGS